MDKSQGHLYFKEIEKITALIDRTANKEPSIIVAIDGNSGAGKSSLASLLSRHYNCNIFHMDDFFLQPHQRTAERLKKPGENIDYERFQYEVVNNLKRNEAFSYQIYDCSKASLTEWVTVLPKKINVIEGVYSMHPLWNHIFDIKIFLTLEPDIQLERIKKRSGEQLLKRFIQEWIPLENKYFEVCKVAQQCDLVINN